MNNSFGFFKWHIGLVVLASWLLCQTSAAAPTSPAPYTFTQPDGSVVQVKLFGDEFYARGETLDGYTVVRDPDTGWISYAVVSEDGESYVSTGIPYKGNDFPQSASEISSLYLSSSKQLVRISLPQWQNVLKNLENQKHLSIAPEQIGKVANRNFERLFPGATANSKVVTTSDGETKVLPPAPPAPSLAALPETTGTVRVLSIIIDFTDAPATATFDEYKASLNDESWSNQQSGASVRGYYKQASQGRLILEHEVFGIFSQPPKHSRRMTQCRTAKAPWKFSDGR